MRIKLSRMEPVKYFLTYYAQKVTVTYEDHIAEKYIDSPGYWIAGWDNEKIDVREAL